MPLIVTIFTIFFGAPFIGVPLEPFPAVALGLSLWGGANGSRDRARRHPAQCRTGRRRPAARSGLRRWQIYRLILLPQAVRRPCCRPSPGSWP